MKIIAKFAFIALVACFITMGGVKANAAGTCDPACVACMQGCGVGEAQCMMGCSSYGGPTCIAECESAYEGCYNGCYGM